MVCSLELVDFAAKCTSIRPRDTFQSQLGKNTRTDGKTAYIYALEISMPFTRTSSRSHKLLLLNSPRSKVNASESTCQSLGQCGKLSGVIALHRMRQDEIDEINEFFFERCFPSDVGVFSIHRS